MKNNLNIDVILSPAMLPFFDIKESIIVAIDILRATSTICTALDQGAKRVIPVASVADCLNYKGDQYIYAAERKGQTVNGFKYGNSPYDYMNGSIKNKILVLTTTNGTGAINTAKDCDQLVAGSFLNLHVLTDWLLNQDRNIFLLCAGWKNHVSMEDTLFAGAVLHNVKSKFNISGDGAVITEKFYSIHKNDIYSIVKISAHPKRLNKIGIEKDIKYCLTPNQLDVIPLLQNNSFVKMNY